MIAYNGSILKYGGSWLGSYVPPPTPIVPSGTLRFQFSDTTYIPYADYDEWGNWRWAGDNIRWVGVCKNPNVWDLELGTNADSINLGDVIHYKWNDPNNIVTLLEGNLEQASGSFEAANNSSLVAINRLFLGSGGVSASCIWDSSVETIEMYNTERSSNWENAFGDLQTLRTFVAPIHLVYHGNYSHMFYSCTNLQVVPTLISDTDSISINDEMFAGCINAASGQVAAYNVLLASGAPDRLPYTYKDTFAGCGTNTVTGAAELAQIPQSWGGTAT